MILGPIVWRIGSRGRERQGRCQFLEWELHKKMKNKKVR